jgi:hypothetical protein
MDDLLIYNARHIGVANPLGMKKISRNMLALQQCVKTIVHDARDGELLRAKQYYSLFFLSPPVCQGSFIVMTSYLISIVLGYACIDPETAEFHVRSVRGDAQPTMRR